MFECELLPIVPLELITGFDSIIFGLEVEVGDKSAVSVGRAGEVCCGDDMAAGGSPDADRLAEEVDDSGKWFDNSGAICKGSRKRLVSRPT